MTSWNYRVIKKYSACTQETTFQIHEVYYRNNGTIDCWNSEPVEPLGVSEANLRNDIHAFLCAFRLPILEKQYINGQAHLIAEQPLTENHHLIEDYASKTSRASGYLSQILGSHILLKQDPSLRQAYANVDRALNELHQLVDNKQLSLNT
jgi:hypothetical protein